MREDSRNKTIFRFFPNPKIKFAIGLAVVLFIFHSFYFYYLGIVPEAVMNLFDDASLPQKEDRLLIFAPHPDDEVLAAGGLMALAKQVGADVRIIVATDGNKRGLKNIRHQETKQAVSVLGIKPESVIFWDYPDAGLKQYAYELPRKISQVLDAYKPTIIVVPSPADNHSDHSVLGAVLMSYLKAGDYQAEVLEYLVHFRYYPRPEGLYKNRYLLPPVALITGDKQWLKLVLTPEIIDLKHEAILKYRSQLRVPLLRALLLSFVRKNELFLKAN